MQQQPTPNPDAAATDQAHFQEVLRDLVDMASDIARHFHHEITTGYADAPAKAAAFDRAARTVRRTILLSQRLDAPAMPQRDPAQHRRTARTHLIRTVEDGIASHAEPEAAETLRAEFRERLDSPNLDDDLDTRPVQDIIDDILQNLGIANLGIAGLANHRLWQRRPPAGIHAIAALADKPPSIRPEIGTIDPATLPGPNPKTRQRCKAKPKLPRNDHTHRRPPAAAPSPARGRGPG